MWISDRSEGAELLFGGKQVLQDTGGYYHEPSIFAGVNNAMRIAQEEIFGPVLSVIPFKTAERGGTNCQRFHFWTGRRGLEQQHQHGAQSG